MHKQRKIMLLTRGGRSPKIREVPRLRVLFYGICVMKTAILIGCAFFVRRAKKLLGLSLDTPNELVDTLFDYCTKHIAIQKNKAPDTTVELYRTLFMTVLQLGKMSFIHYWGKMYFSEELLAVRTCRTF